MDISDYFAGVSREMQLRSDRIRDSFKSHRATVGSNRETVIEQFLAGHLPAAFGVGAGIIVGRDGALSNQADVVIYDQVFNAPLHSDLSDRIFTVESVYALIEAKSTLTPTELADSIKKGRRFKAIERKFSEVSKPRIVESLFIVFAFDAAEPTTFRDTLAEQLCDVPADERPDFIVVANSLVAKSGSYLELSKQGQPNSQHRAEIMQKPLDPKLKAILERGFDISVLGDHTLLAFFIWCTSWLQRAGHRTTDLQLYLPPNMTFGLSI